MVLICADEDIQKREIERYVSRRLLPEREPSKVTHVQNRCVVRLFELMDEFMLELSLQYAQVIYILGNGGLPILPCKIYPVQIASAL